MGRTKRSGLVTVSCTALVMMVFTCSTVLAADDDASSSGVPAEALQSWHQQIRAVGKPGVGCFTADYPTLAWSPVSCDSAARIPTGHPVVIKRSVGGKVRDEVVGAGAETVGNGNDYSAESNGLTTAATGSFPTVTGVTATVYPYSLQLNTNIGSSPACSAYGYSSCKSWEQFIYVTTYYPFDGDAEGSHAFIQNWLFVPADEYSTQGCPSGFNDGGDATFSDGDYHGCVVNSAAVATPEVPASSLAEVKLEGTAETGGNDTVTFTYGTKAYATNQSDDLVDIGAIWNESEFNIVGDGGGSGATFNSGSTLGVKITLQDGTTSAPTCLSNAGTTGETNNLTLGSCTSAGGAAPSISFRESN